jgi:hypothetical protein
MSRWWTVAQKKNRMPKVCGDNVSSHTFGVRKILGDTKPVVSLRSTTG